MPSMYIFIYILYIIILIYIIYRYIGIIPLNLAAIFKNLKVKSL